MSCIAVTFQTRFRLLLCAVACAATIARPASAQTDSAFTSFLESGEFGPALELVRANRDPVQRDAQFRRLAEGQAAAGSLRASVDTALLIDDQRLRGRTLGALHSMPVGRGGGPIADFDSLIELMTTTIAPTTWDIVGGPGSVSGFDGGVYVDAMGLLCKLNTEAGDVSLGRLRHASAASSGSTQVRKTSRLRNLSLNRLERAVQKQAALGREPDEIMKSMAGLFEIKYLFVYPGSNDLVIAGPAGDWDVNAEGRKLSVTTGKPVLQLDDFVVCLRNAYDQNSRFGCSITPRTEHLARTRRFLDDSAKRPLGPSVAARKRWLDQLRAHMGRQDIDVYGVDPRTRVARVLIEADYRMKLVGMGLEDGTLGVQSYLESLSLDEDGAPELMSVLRWWFTLNYTAISTTVSRDAFQIHGQAVKVLGENEFLTELGERRHTGTADEHNARFAHSFTKHFPRLAAKYPVYAELKNVFDLALFCALLRAEDLPAQAGWQMAYFNSPTSENDFTYRVAFETAPSEVETVINHRMLGRRHVVAGVSGGVSVDARPLVQPDALQIDQYGLMKAERVTSMPDNRPSDTWWWD